jgi:predicted ATPase
LDDETALKNALTQLEQAELVFRRGEPPEAIYRFKHALVRDAAYESLLKSRRQPLHGQVARALEERFVDIVASQPELVAHHFTEAGLIEKAIGYWLQAGKNAALRSANLEAIAHLQRGIEVTGHLAGGESKDKLELNFQLVLGPCLIATQGPAASTAVATFARARELCERLGEPPEYLQVMFWLATVSVVRGELPAALEAVEALLSAAEGRDDRPALINAIRGRAMILFFLGRIVDAHEAIERAVEVFNASQEADKMAARAAGQDAGVAMLALMSWVLWILGQVDGAVNKIAAALERADAVNHAHTHAYAWYYASVLHVLRGEPAIAQAYSESCLAISEQHGFRQWLGLSRAIPGICAAVLDASGSGLDKVKAALEEYQRAGYQLGITAQFVLMCQALLLRNESEAALEVIDHGLSVAGQNSERAFEPELYRLKASAVVMLGAPDVEAESLLDQALRTARSQQAQSLELRAAIDLARLWTKQGKRADARDVLSSV